MVGGVQKALVFMLATQVDAGSHEVGLLANARHGPVDAHARTTIGTDPALNRQTLGIVRLPEDPARNEGTLSTLAHGREVGPLAHKQFEGGEQRGFTRARLTRENRHAGTGNQVRLADKRDILYMDFIDHRALHKRRGTRNYKSSRGRNRAGGYRPDRAGR